MINEKPKEGVSFQFPYYAYAEKNLTVSPSTEGYLTLTFSSSVYGWGSLMITALAQAANLYVNIRPMSETTAQIRVWNYYTSAITATIRVMALLPNNISISLS